MESHSDLFYQNRPRGKSAPYPAVSIAVAYEFLQLIDRLGGSSVPYADIISAMGLASASTKSFLNRISASKQFGFITTGSNMAHLTDFGRRILSSGGNEDRVKGLLIEAFKNPPLYAQLIGRFCYSPVPPKEYLANILQEEYGIIPPVKDNAAACFLASANHLGLLRDGILCIGPPAPAQPAKEPEPHPGVETAEADVRKEAREAEFQLEVPMPGKKSACLHIPGSATAEDIDYVKLYIEKMLPVFLNALKEKLP